MSTNRSGLSNGLIQPVAVESSIRSTFWQQCILSLFAGKRRSRSHRRRVRSTLSAECLEARMLLDGSFAFQQVGQTESLEYPPIQRDKPIVTSTGNLFYVEPASSEGHSNLKIVTPGDKPQSATATTVLADVAGLSSFDVNGAGAIASIQTIEDVGDVVSYSSPGEPLRYLLIDGEGPQAYLDDAPNPSLGDTATTFTVMYYDYGSFIDDRQQFLGDEIVFSGPGGRMNVTPFEVAYDGNTVAVSYAVRPGDGVWDSNDSGTYVVSLADDSVKDLAGNGISATALYDFELDWSPEQTYQTNQTDVPGYSKGHTNSFGYDFILSHSFDFVSQDRFMYADPASETLDNPGIRLVAISETGRIAFAGTTDREFLGEWNPGDGVATVGMADSGVNEIEQIDIADAGQIAAEFDRRVYLIDLAIGRETLIMQGSLIYGVRISNDATKVFFDDSSFSTDARKFSSTIYVYDATANVTHRISGITEDGTLDAGERWKRDKGGALVDVSSQPAELTRIVGSGQSGNGEYWVAYEEFSVLDPNSLPVETQLWMTEPVVRVSSRRITFDHDNQITIGLPVLLGSHAVKKIQLAGPLIIWPEDYTATAFDPKTKTFHTVLTELYQFSGYQLGRFYSSGIVPDRYTGTDFSNESSRHIELEKLAREIAYWELRDPDSKFQRGTVLDNGYVIEGMYVEHEGANLQNGFQELYGTFEAVVLLPFDSDGKGAPIIAFRGSDGEDLTSTALEAEGVGFSQFKAMESWVLDWVERVSKDYDQAPIFTGHSLGGALSQWFTTSVLQNTTHGLSEVVTFNSPGISFDAVEQTVEAVASRITNGVTHYIVSGDFVSLAGEKFIDGTVHLVTVNGVPVIWDWLESGLQLVPRHTLPILNSSIEDSNGKVVSRPEIIGTSIRSDTTVLNHPEFNFLQDAGYVSFLGTASVALPQTAHHLVARQRVERLRKTTRFDWPALKLLQPGMHAQVFVSLNVEVALRTGASEVAYNYETFGLTANLNAPLIAAAVMDTGIIAVTNSAVSSDARTFEFHFPGWTPLTNVFTSQGRYFISTPGVQMSRPTVVEIIGGEIDHPRELSWPPRAGVASFEFWMDNLLTGQKKILHKTGINTSSLELPQLPDGTYRYWVRTETENGVGAWSMPRDIEIQGQVIVARQSGGNLTWPTVAGATSYELWIDNSTTGQKKVIRETGLLSSEYELPVLPDGDYVYWIQQEDDHGKGPWSSPAEFQIRDGKKLNAAPKIELPESEVVVAGQAFTILMSATDADGDPLTITTSVLVDESTAALAWRLDQERDLSPRSEDYGVGWMPNAKLFWSNYGVDYITDDGSLYHDVQGGEDQLIAMLDPSYYENPKKLDAALQPSADSIANLQVIGDSIHVTPDGNSTGAFTILVSATDGSTTVTRHVTVNVVDPTRDAAVAWLDWERSLIKKGSYSYNWGGQQEKWIAVEYVNEWYFVLPTGELRLWNGGTDILKNSKSVAMLPIAFYRNPSLLHEAGEQADDIHRLVQLDSDLQLTNGNSPHSFNSIGLNEKWIASKSGEQYFLLPDNSLHQWDTASQTSNFVSKLPEEIYAEPQRLHDAFNAVSSVNPHAIDVLAPSTPQKLDAYFEFWIDATGTHQNWGHQNEKWFKGDGNDWFFIKPSGDVYMWGTSMEDSQWMGRVDERHYQQLVTLTRARELSDIPEMSLAVTLDNDLKLWSDGKNLLNWGGWNEKWIRGANNKWYFITPSGALYAWNGGRLENSTALADLDAAFYGIPELLFNAMA